MRRTYFPSTSDEETEELPSMEEDIQLKRNRAMMDTRDIIGMLKNSSIPEEEIKNIYREIINKFIEQL